MRRIRIYADQVVRLTKTIEISEKDFQQLRKVWLKGPYKDLEKLAEGYLDTRKDIVDWDSLTQIDIFDSVTGKQIS